MWAHRGGGRLAPENTLAGIAQAVALGCRGVEFDAMLSSDGVPVLIHDETVARTTPGAGRVADLTAAELTSLDAGSWWGAQWAGEPIPTLEQALSLGRAHGLFLNVEIKPAEGHAAATGKAVAQAVAAGMLGFEDRVVLSSFSEMALAAARQAAPALPRALLVGDVPTDWLARCRGLGCVALHVAVGGLSEPTVREIKAQGLRLAAYTENAPDRAARYLGWGVDAIVTDRPDLILDPQPRPGL